MDENAKSRHPAACCHQCGRKMSSFSTSMGGPGAGVCEEHGISYGKEYIGPGSIWDEDGSLCEDHPDVTEELKERVNS